MIGAPKLGFEALEREKNEIVRWRHENGYQTQPKGRTRSKRETHLLKIASGARFGSVGECKHQWGRTTQDVVERKGKRKGFGKRKGPKRAPWSRGRQPTCQKWNVG